MNLITKLALALNKRLQKYLDARQEEIQKELWDQRLADALLLFSTEKSKWVEAVLKNQIEFLNRDRQASGGQTNPEIQKVMFDVAVETLMQLKIDDIVGVQPMQGPVGLVYFMQYKNIKERQDGSKGAALEVVSQAVEAGSRKLQARWTIEARQDLLAQHGIDIQKELIKVYGAEIALEITTEILHDLMKNAPHTRTFEWKAYKDPLVSVHDEIDRLLVNIDVVANEIARTTRRGRGNFIVCQPMVVALLQASKRLVPAPNRELGHALGFVGHLTAPDGTPMYKVYTSLTLFDPAVDPSERQEEILIGYKGLGTIDVGYVYSPYIAIMSGGVSIDPNTFQPVVPLTTRYGKAFSSSSVSLEEKEKGITGCVYYGKITISGLSFQ